MCQNFLCINIRPSRIQDPLEYKTHQKVLKIDIRPSYNREITVSWKWCYFEKESGTLKCCNALDQKPSNKGYWELSKKICILVFYLNMHSMSSYEDPGADFWKLNFLQTFNFDRQQIFSQLNNNHVLYLFEPSAYLAFICRILINGMALLLMYIITFYNTSS